LVSVVNPNALIIFVKYPQSGSVKRRLAKDIGRKNATVLYRLFVEGILKRTKDRRFERIIFFTPSQREREIRKWLGDNLEFYPQKGKNLGKRLSYAFQTVFKKRGARRAIVIGTDSPLIDKSLICKGFEKLKNNQCVIGPSRDGGYYLLGLSKFKRKIFQNIDWGTNRVFKQTLNTIKNSKLKFSLLEVGFDIDTKEDLVLLKEYLRKLDKTDYKGLLPLIDLLSTITLKLHNRRGVDYD
jgi:hypothetical protein